MPKAELHIHIEGSLEPEMMFEMAVRNRVTLRYSSVREVREAYDFSDLQSFLDLYYEGTRVLLYERDFYELTWAYLQRASSQGVRHAEIFFDPQAHTDRGVNLGTVITGLRRALEDGERRLGVSSHLILCFLRHLSAREAMETLHQALPYKQWIVGVGLDSSEVGHPPEDFGAVFEEAGRLGFRKVAHAGEEGPPEYIWQALDDLGGGQDRPRRQVRGGFRAGTEAQGGADTADRLPALEREAAGVPFSRRAPRKADARRGVVRDGELRRSGLLRWIRGRQLLRREGQTRLL